MSEKIDTYRTQFLNIHIDNLTASQAKEVIEKLLHLPGYHYVVTPNVDIVVKMQNDAELKRICDNADLILADGMGVIQVSRFLNRPIKERVAMTDFVWDVCDLANDNGYKIFLFGGKESVLSKATRVVKERYPKLNIVDSYSPPLGFENSEEQLSYANERIKKSGADILIVFLGCPKQEKYIAGNKDIYQVPISITMGGCVDFIAGGVKRAPMWMQRVGLEWFYRFLQEPQRMYKRYFIDDIKIFRLVFRYKLEQIKKKKVRVDK